MNRPDALLYSVAFVAYMLSFLGFILHVALRRRSFGTAATWLSGFGAIPHTGAFACRWVSQGHVPLANMYEYMGLMAWMVVVSLLLFMRHYRNLKIGVFFMPIAVMLLVTASLLPSDINRQLMPALQSTWLAIHVTLAALGSGAFLIAFAASSLYLLSADETSRKKNSRMGGQGEMSLYWGAWVGIPVLTALVLNLSGILPVPIRSLAEARYLGLTDQPLTAFAFGSLESPELLGRWAIGLGIGMVLAAILWPFAHERLIVRRNLPHDGARYFVVLVVTLLLAAVFIGFLIQAEVIRLTPRSYFKVFEFFGPTLMASWFLFPFMRLALLKKRGGWIERLDLARSGLEDIAYTAVAIGYPLYTIGALFAGAIWAEQAWGTWWSWDPKEVGALIIWLFYTGYLHARYQRQWRGKRAAILVVFGMMMIFVSFFGNYFFGGLHSFEVG